MGTFTAAGSELAISAGIPATQTEAGYTALTFTDIGGVEKIGPIGITWGKTEFQPLKGVKEKHKGGKDAGALNPSIGVDETDAGQSLLRTANEALTALYAIRVKLSNGKYRWAQGRVFGFPETVDNAESVVMANPVIEICTDWVRSA